MESLGKSYGNSSSPFYSRTPVSNGVNLVFGHTIDPEPDYWLWRGYLAIGHITIIAGELAANIDAIAATFVSILSSRGIFPDGSNAPDVMSLILTGEHCLGTSIARQLELAGASQKRFVYIRGENKEGQSRPLELTKDQDLDKVKRKLSEIDPANFEKGGLLIVFLDEVSNKKGSLKRRLTLLRETAEIFHLAVLVVVNLSRAYNAKSSIVSNLGNKTYVSESSVVLVAAKVESDSSDVSDPSKEGGHVLVRAASKIGPNGGGFGYRTQSVENKGYTSTRVIFDGTFDGSPAEILGAGEDDNTNLKPTATYRAAEFLTAILVERGPLPVAEIEALAKQVGVSMASIRRVKIDLPIVARREKGVDQEMRWVWYWIPGSNQNRQPDFNGLNSPHQPDSNRFNSQYCQTPHYAGQAAAHFPVRHVTTIAQVENHAHVADVAHVADEGCDTGSDSNDFAKFAHDQMMSKIHSMRARMDKAKTDDELTPVFVVDSGSEVMAVAMSAAKAEAGELNTSNDEYAAAYADAHLAAYSTLIATGDKKFAMNAATNAAYAATRNEYAADDAISKAFRSVMDTWDECSVVDPIEHVEHVDHVEQVGCDLERSVAGKLSEKNVIDQASNPVLSNSVAMEIRKSIAKNKE